MSQALLAGRRDTVALGDASFHSTTLFQWMKWSTAFLTHADCLADGKAMWVRRTVPGW